MRTRKRKVDRPVPRYSLNLDPGFAWTGYSVTVLGTMQVMEMGLIRTEKSDKKLRVRDADDNQRRVREISRRVRILIEQWNPVVITGESYSAPRNASTAGKQGLVYGAIFSIAEEFDLPVIFSTPQEIKKAVCGKRSASKEEIANACEFKYGTSENEEVIAEFESAWAPGQHNHAWDSLGAYIAAGDSEVMKALQVMT